MNMCTLQDLKTTSIPYKDNQPVELNSWDEEAYSISIFETVKFLDICCGNHQTQSPIATQVSKALSRQSSGKNHKRTRQGVSAKLESYIYKVHMVRATNNYACPYVHATTSCLPHSLLKATMLYICALTLSF